MAREDILAMEAGRKLDAHVAEQVMCAVVDNLEDSWTSDRPPEQIGWVDYLAEKYPKVTEKDGTHYPNGWWRGLLAYSIDMFAAWQVVEKMRENVSGVNGEGNILFGRFCDALIEVLDIDNEWETSAANGVWDIMRSLSPEVVCKAALLAKLGH